MRILLTGGSGVLGRATMPLLEARGHGVSAPSRTALDLFDSSAVARAVESCDAVFHLATRIPRAPLEDVEAWQENDRLRSEASRNLVDAALGRGVVAYVQPTITFVYPMDGVVDEETPVVPDKYPSALEAEKQAARFASAGRRGVVLRLGFLDGPGTGNAAPVHSFGATLHVEDAGRALVAAVSLPSGIYNVCRDGEHVSNDLFKRASGWNPRR